MSSKYIVPYRIKIKGLNIKEKSMDTIYPDIVDIIQLLKVRQFGKAYAKKLNCSL